MSSRSRPSEAEMTARLHAIGDRVGRQPGARAQQLGQLREPEHRAGAGTSVTPSV